MIGLDDMRSRLGYAGGSNQQGRMIKDKLRSLKKSLLYSYQAGTLVINNPNYDEDALSGIESLKTLEFRCLMNPDKLSKLADLNILSIPFEDICLNYKPEENQKTSDNFMKIPISSGDTFIWKETDTRWIVTLPYNEELAYFRADVRKCWPYPLIIDDYPNTVEPKAYFYASVGQEQQTAQWQRRNRQIVSGLNYTKVLYIKRDEVTLNYFKRFKQIRLMNLQKELEPWDVQAVESDDISDVLLVYIKETDFNRYEDLSNEIKETQEFENEINDYLTVTVYDQFYLTTTYVENAMWNIENSTEGLKFKLDATKDSDETKLTITLLNGKTGEFDVYYNNVKIKHVIVKSL